MLRYPSTRRESVVDDYHGTKIADPYRWLEGDVRESREVADWVAAQNRVTRAYLEAIPEREAIKERLTRLWDYEKMSVPAKRGARYFLFRNDGLQNQPVLCVTDSLDADPRVLIDPNTWSEDGTIALVGWSFSPDGKFVATAASEAGTDWFTWRFLDVEAGRLLNDEVKWCKYPPGAAELWSADGTMFFYGRFPEPATGTEYQAGTLNHKVYVHRLGTPQSDDALVYERPDNPNLAFAAEVTDDGVYLIVHFLEAAGPKNGIAFKELGDPRAAPVVLFPTLDHEFAFVGNDGPVLFFKTDLDAPMGRLIAADVRDPERRREIIPEQDHSLSSVSIVGNHFAATYLNDAASQVRIFTMDGSPLREIPLPGLGTLGVGNPALQGHRGDPETFFSFESLVAPPRVYRHDMNSGRTTPVGPPPRSFRPDDFELRRVFYTSKDGTRVPMFIAHKKGIATDGPAPTILMGYGGFQIPSLPLFRPGFLGWMDLGGVFALANIRGGGEYGEAWHRAGMKHKKQNVFDDFIAAAEWLVAQRVTRTEQLAILGGSGGGKLVGAVMTQRPELFGACVPIVGIFDMLRFHRFTAGRFWVEETGSSDDPEEFRTLLAYSPLHNVREGTRYPPTIIPTADTDDRVVPLHSFKYAAALQHAQAGEAPILLRVESRAGHGLGMPTAKLIEMTTDMWSFLVKHLGLRVPASHTGTLKS